MNAQVELVASRAEEWGERFRAMRLRLSLLLPFAAVEHIGSTSIPKLPAKDVVDVLIGVTASNVEDAVGVLVRAGFDREGSRDGHAWLSWPNRRQREYVLHVVELGSTHWVERLAFRDLLRDSGDLRTRYLAVKRAAAEQAHDWGEYTARKADIVREILKEGQAWRPCNADSRR